MYGSVIVIVRDLLCFCVQIAWVYNSHMSYVTHFTSQACASKARVKKLEFLIVKLYYQTIGRIKQK